MQDTSYHLRVNTGRDISYSDYCSLLVSTATTYVAKHKPRTFPYHRNNNSRNAYFHDINSDSYQYDTPEEDGEDFNISTYVTEIQAYSKKFIKFKRDSNRTNLSSSLLSPDIYKSIDNKSLSSWKKMDPDVRTRIVKSINT